MVYQALYGSGKYQGSEALLLHRICKIRWRWMGTIWCLFTKFKFRGASQRWKYRHTQKTESLMYWILKEDCVKRKTFGDEKSIKPILKPSKRALRIKALTIPFHFWRMMTARSSGGLTLR